MRNRALVALLTCTALYATSCTRGGETVPRPATLVDTISIEGRPEPMTLNLVESPAAFPLPFSTYLPPGMNVEFIADSAAVKFIAAFNGTVQPKAFVHVQRLVADGSAGAPNEPADAMVARLLDGRSLGNTELMRGAPPWASDGAAFAYTEDGKRYEGSFAIRTAEGTPFRVLIHMPSEYGIGMGPRVQTLLEHWRWADGAPLIP